MISFLLSLVALVLGYFSYGVFVENVFGADPSRRTPAYTQEDGVDFVPLGWSRIFLIQFLNIAGLGPIYGAILGALYGPAAFLWIVLGSIFAGGVHDYFSGMLSIRHEGKSVSEIVGIYLGRQAKIAMIAFSVILLILIGTVFMSGPAGLLTNLGFTGLLAHPNFWLALILLYYFAATVFPIDKIISRIYPLFGAVLLIMALSIGSMLLIKGYEIPEIAFRSFHPDGLPLWPMLFITIACGAVSGFHSTQSPIMARCLTNEKYGRRIFYGAMIAEGIIALIWAAAAMSFFPGGVAGLSEITAAGGAALVVKNVSLGLLGPAGGILAILGVIACPITSGDTAFRSARLTIADAMNLDQRPLKNRLIIAFPIFAMGFSLTLIDFSKVWRYFAFSNQVLATIVLWTSAVYLSNNDKFHWIATTPATFMTAVVTTYILQAPEGFGLPGSISYPAGMICAAAFCVLFATFLRKRSLSLALLSE
ncbi:carbon starvation protein CstA [Methanosarcina sp. 2.H.T.1A.6]|uniref:carbon starvation CstA family protein n=1 Tax=unclassified Methanosarcina TaxID=2644672 RepID=UPI000621566F|nr:MULTISPECIES: carbon starvation protein A [unclassified Methanosarcina]KKG16721.1 carbon starvation protein CstA [Methanosarcina sp. 2.H.T.1A.3]KKG22820.1 carbon starvation protein CstA [Methanosarcina sp. 2.H.T.1A.6]KKG24450.1 carbon starvation protein CstA [Methanosarcina sp. 2.H.T.1A.8]